MKQSLSQYQVQNQQQVQVQTLSPQQVLQVRVLELSLNELEERVRLEMDDNPALEIGEKETDLQADEPTYDETPSEEIDDNYEQEERQDALQDVLMSIGADDEMPNFRNRPDEEQDVVFGETRSFQDELKEQMCDYDLNETEKYVLEYLIGSLDDDGYLRRDTELIAEELALYHNVDVDVSDVNRMISEGKIVDMIMVAEAFQEKRIASVAEAISKRPGIKMVLISGPSSSGKTTTCKRLSVQLGVLGYHPVQISVDDFFVERDETPKDKDGNYDFEALEAIDLPLFNKTLSELIEGKRVELPTFNFALGKKEWKGKSIQLDENSIMVIEGIHCLNPKLTEQVSDDVKFKIFVSALTSISIDRQNPIPTTDNRLIRRIVRDFNYRGYSAQETLSRWASVRNGEEKNIFPYQENADEMINTSLIFELGVLKPYASFILRAVPETAVEYAEAVRLLKFLSYFKYISEDNIPGTSILREFVGGSKFSY